MPRNATWNILSVPVLGSNRSGIILMVSVSDVRNVDWELNISGITTQHCFLYPDHKTVVGSSDWF